jgi:ribosomal protein L15
VHRRRSGRGWGGGRGKGRPRHEQKGGPQYDSNGRFERQTKPLFRSACLPTIGFGRVERFRYWSRKGIQNCLLSLFAADLPKVAQGRNR